MEQSKICVKILYLTSIVTFLLLRVSGRLEQLHGKRIRRCKFKLDFRPLEHMALERKMCAVCLLNGFLTRGGALLYKPIRDVPFFRVSFFSINPERGMKIDQKFRNGV